MCTFVTATLCIIWLFKKTVHVKLFIFYSCRKYTSDKTSIVRNVASTNKTWPCKYCARVINLTGIVSEWNNTRPSCQQMKRVLSQRWNTEIKRWRQSQRLNIPAQQHNHLNWIKFASHLRPLGSRLRIWAYELPNISPAVFRHCNLHALLENVSKCVKNVHFIT